MRATDHASKAHAQGQYVFEGRYNRTVFLRLPMDYGLWTYYPTRRVGFMVGRCTPVQRSLSILTDPKNAVHCRVLIQTTHLNYDRVPD
jgi:hypothetical protein